MNQLKLLYSVYTNTASQTKFSHRFRSTEVAKKETFREMVDLVNRNKFNLSIKFRKIQARELFADETLNLESQVVKWTEKRPTKTANTFDLACHLMNFLIRFRQLVSHRDCLLKRASSID